MNARWSIDKRRYIFADHCFKFSNKRLRWREKFGAAEGGEYSHVHREVGHFLMPVVRIVNVLQVANDSA